jgi:hypothetical protein
MNHLLTDCLFFLSSSSLSSRLSVLYYNNCTGTGTEYHGNKEKKHHNMSSYNVRTVPGTGTVPIIPGTYLVLEVC